MPDVSDPEARTEMCNEQLYGATRDVPYLIRRRHVEMDHVDQACVIERSSWYCGEQVIGPFASLRDADDYAVRAGRGEGGPRWRSSFWAVALVDPEDVRESIATHKWHEPERRSERPNSSSRISGLRREENPLSQTWEWDGPCVVMGAGSLVLGNHRPIGPFVDTAEAVAYGEGLGVPDHVDWFVEALVKRRLDPVV